MPRVNSVRNGQANFDLHIRDDLPEMYCDGVSESMLGVPFCKLTLHTLVSPGRSTPEKPEIRNAVARLTLPTFALLELCLNVIQSTVEAGDNVVAATKENNDRMIELLEKLKQANQK